MGYLEILITVVSAVATIAGVGTYINYRIQKRDELKAHARLVLLEIQGIEAEMDKLRYRLHIQSEDILQTTPIYSAIKWNDSKHLLSKTKWMKPNYIIAINDFYKAVENFEDARVCFKQSVMTNRNSKIIAVNNELAKIAVSAKSIADMNTEMDLFAANYAEYGHDCNPTSYIKFFERMINNYEPISNTPAHSALIKIRGKN